MDDKQRHKRVRLLVSKVNKARKKQAQKIDMLCNNLVAAYGDFIKRLNTISFTANFYESIMGVTELNGLFYTADKLIKDEIADANIAFFLCEADSFKLHIPASDQPITFEKHPLENCFTPELVDNICKSNKLCTLDCLLAMGLQGNPAMLNKISAATIPMGQFSQSLGFILIYRSSEKKLNAEELNRITAVTSGLSRAIQSCQVLSHSSD